MGIHYSKDTEFKKGFIPWNKGLKGTQKANSGSFKKGEHTNQNNLKWKGDKVGYGALHTWIKRKLGNAIICNNCNFTRDIEWANKSHKYKRDLSDWLQLCRVCHRKYDGITKIDYPDIIHLKNNGINQQKIAEILNVDQSTISRGIKRYLQREGFSNA